MTPAANGGDVYPPGDPGSVPTQSDFFGEYEILEEIARGGMGIVYRARQFRLGREVALKMIPETYTPSLNQRFPTEADAAARLDHPHIVPIYEVGEHRGRHFFTMKLMDGGNLQERIRKRGSLETREAREPGNHDHLLNRPAQKKIARWIADVARAIHYAHERGILHRDLKPSNVLMDRLGQVYVADFGLAKIAELDGNLTLSSATLGTPSYMAPEQATGKTDDLTTAADVYSLGAILYECLTGAPPFSGVTSVETLRRVVEENPTAPRSIAPEIDRDLETICLKCLAKEPSGRYPTAGAMADDLERWAEGIPILARPTTTRERLWRWSRRRPAVAASLAAVALLTLMLAIGSTVALIQIQAARKSEQRENYYARIGLAQKQIETGDITRAKENLARRRAEFRHREWGHLIYLCHQEILSIDAHSTPPIAHSRPGGEQSGVRTNGSPDPGSLY